MKGFALRLVMKRRHKRTRKWPIRALSLETDARFVFELDKWGSMPPDKYLDGEHEVPAEFVLHVHVVDTELSTDLDLNVLKRLL